MPIAPNAHIQSIMYSKFNTDLRVCQDASQYIELNPFNTPPSYFETNAAKLTIECIGSAVLIINVCVAPLKQLNHHPLTWVHD